MAFPVPETPRRDLFPEIEAYASGYMKTDGVHEIYYEECGNPRGKPVRDPARRPGRRGQSDMRRFFDPAKWRMVAVRPARLRQQLAPERLAWTTTPPGA
jgi:proline iminopeptidase